MKKKALFTILTIVLIILCGLSLFGCKEGEVPVESIVITKLPKLEYYRGDFFELNASEITVYYENGTSKIVPLTLEMLSTYDAENIGDQTLTIKYENSSAYIKVSVVEAPIYGIAIVEGNYKKEYIQDQLLDLQNLNLKITYSNNFTETIPVVSSMLSGFDTQTIGEKQLIVTYKGKTAKFNINVVKKAIKNVSIETPRKLSYVVGDKIDFTEGKIFIAYNNNTQEYKNIVDILSDPKLIIKIDNVVTDTFTQAGVIKYVTVTYDGFECLYAVNVVELKAKKIEIVTHPTSPVINSASVTISGGIIKITYNNGDIISVNADAKNLKDYWRIYNIVDMSAGSVKITYNNNTSEIISTDDERVEILWKEFDNSKLGVYEIGFLYQEVQLDYDIEVIDAKELEIIILDYAETVYQDSGDIDITEWSYKIRLANNTYRAFDSLGSIIAPVNENMIKQGTDPNFSTALAGTRSFVFEYISLDTTVTLTKTITVTVIAKQIESVEEFTEPTIKVYGKGDIIDTSGGKFKLKYNDGSITDWINITKDMQIESDATLTSTIDDNVEVGFLYKDTLYNSSIILTFNITVVRKANALTYEINSSIGLKQNYILGETFDSEKLVVKINFADGGTKMENDFSAAEWSFTNTNFDSIGNQNVRLYYGDISNNIFVNIPVIVTNNIISIVKGANFVDFGTVIEGMDISIPENAYIVVTRQNNTTTQVKVLMAMTNYNKADKTLGTRVVTISYDNFTLSANVNVVARTLTQFSITNRPTKLNYVYTDTAIDLTGLQLNFKFNNNTTATVSGTSVMNLTVFDENESEITYNLAVGANIYYLVVSKLDNDLNGSQYLQQNIYLSVFSGDNLLFRASYEIVCFLKLIDRILFEIPFESEQSFILKEGDDFAFPSNAQVKVIYADSTIETFNFSTLSANEYEVLGYNKDKAGIQTLILKYFFKECSFSVKVRAKLLQNIIATPNSITVIEGMAISSDDLAVKLHFVDADGTEFMPIKYIDVELNSVACSYNKNTPVTFNRQDGNNHWYYEDYYTISYIYNYYDFLTKSDKSIVKSTQVLIRINRKTITDISMRSYPKTVYIEDIEGQPSAELDLSGGSVLVSYNNGTSTQIDLSNANLTIFDNNFDTSEINNGSERNQKIIVSYTENNVSMSTYYTVVIKDRQYLTINFEESPSNNTYLFEYGTGESARPNFYVSGYLTYDGARVVLTDNSDIDTIEGFSLYYIDKNNNESNVWPKDAGTYTLAIKFVGNGVNNPFIDTTRKIEIFPKTIVVRAEEKTLTYGQTYSNEHSVFSWYVQGYHKNGNVITYTDNPLVYGELQDIVANISFRVTTKNAQSVTFFNANGVIIVTAAVGTYNLNPYLVQKLSQNYKIEEYKASDLIIQQKDIKIVAQNATKVYGQSDPRFEFAVFDTDNIAIGGNIGGPSQIWLGGYLTGYSDAIPSYSLGRLTNDTNNVMDNHKILAGAASSITNYRVVAYTEAKLTITPKPITVCGDALQKSYASATPIVVFRLKTGSSMAYTEVFTTIFAQHINKSGNKYDLSIYESSDLNSNLAINNDLPTVTAVGSYKIKLNIISSDIPNYDITVELVDLTIVPTQVNITLNCISSSYDPTNLDLIADTDELGWYKYQVSSGNRSIAFESGYLLDGSQLNLGFIKEEGKNVGKYQIKISNTCRNSNSNYALNLIGNYGSYYSNFVSTYYPSGVPEGVPASAGSDASKSYLIILPTTLTASFNRLGEVYSRKSSIWLDTEYYVLTDKLDNISVISGLNSALSYSLTNKDITKANLGYYTADNYFGKYSYNYFANENSKNYLCFGTMPATAQKEIYNYILNGNLGSFVITYDFDYTIFPYELDVTILNNNVDYNGLAISLTYSNYALAHPSDTVNIVNDIKVVYYDTTAEVTASKVQEAGAYKINMIGVSNYNYCLSAATLSRIKNITISPISLKILIDETKLTRGYSGKAIQPIDNNWVDTKGENDEIGYFRTTTYKIVNDVLLSAPKIISIYPVDASNNTPRNAGVYDLVVRINSTYKNLTVLFVKRNPEWNTGDSIETKYIATDYKFNITQKKITIYNWDKCNKKSYDNTEPLVNNLNQLIINNTVAGDVLTTSDLIFTFSRDMTKVPSTMLQMVSESDMVSAGYFNVEISIKHTNANWQNYYFEIDGTEKYYLINRVSVPITLNTSNSSLTKQYDKNIPTGVFSELNLGQVTVLDDIYYDIVIVSYFKNSVWTSWSGNTVFDVGNYSYNLRAKYKTGVDTYIYYENELGEPIYDSTFTTNKLLSWNYCYYIIRQEGLDTNNCDGVYTITKKDIAISLAEAKDEIYDYGGGNQALRYVYSHIYNNQAITLATALNEINTKYKIVDKNGDDLDLLYYNNFSRQNLTGTGSTVRNAGEYFNLSFVDLINANSNFNITNKPIVYAVKKLEVNLSLTFKNTNNSNLPSMIFGDKVFETGKINFALDFANIAAFNAATGYSYSNINNFISNNIGDYSNDKLIISQTEFKLVDYLQNICYTSTRGSTVSGLPYNRLDAGNYTTTATGFSAMNYQINIIGVTFTVASRNIEITGIKRDYFNTNISTEYSIIGGSIDSFAENEILSSWHFIDNTLVNADASNFASNNTYYGYILKSEMVTNNSNYTITVTQCTGLSGTNQAYYYIPLTVNRVNLLVGFTNSIGSTLSVQYGHTLTFAEYKLTYGNLPIIDFDSSVYSPATEASKQNEALATIENMFINIQAIINKIKITAVGNYSFSLNDYIKEGANINSLTNYIVTLSSEVPYTINKIVINLELINNAGTDYNENGYFSVIFDEINSLSYSTSSNQRLTYSFNITNPNSIIKPDGVTLTTLVERMTYILGLTIDGNGKVVFNYTPTEYTNYNDFVVNYINTNIKYQINAQNGSSEYSAGLCKIKLTDNWYSSQNYTLSCSFKNIMVYPKIKFIGNSDNEVPFSAFSLNGLPADYGTAIQNLSIYLQIFYNGFNEGENVQWIDTFRNVISPYYAGANYNRTWTINIVDGQVIAVGNDIRLTITMSESFYNDMGVGTTVVVNTITSKEFVVRLYGPEQSTALASTNSQIVKGTDSSVYNYKEKIEGNYTYYFSDSSVSTNHYNGKFDILNIKLKLNPIANSASYYTDILLLDNATNSLVLRISGGSAASYQVIMTDKVGNNIYYSAMLPGLEQVDLFDGMSHTLKIYIDKLGFKTNYVEEIVEESIVITAQRNYKLMWVIDDAYSCNLEYNGGKVTETNTFNQVSGLLETEYNYEKYINFDNNGKFGFILVNSTIEVISFSADKMGVRLTTEGYISDFMLWPSAFSNNYSYFITSDGEVNTENILQTISFNSGYGYNNILIETLVKDDKTNQTVTGTLVKGTYLLTITSFYRLSDTVLRQMETRTIRLIISQSSYKKVGINNAPIPNYSVPTIYQSENGNNYFTDMLGAYSYSKMVFDYANVVPENSSVSTIILKTNENRTSNITSYDENYPNYKGIALKITYDSNTLSYTTEFQMRIGTAYFNQIFYDIDWSGSRNILETRYSKASGIVLITLYRGGTLLFSHTLKNGLVPGLSGQLIKSVAEMSGYISLNLFNTQMKMYAMELDSKIDTNLDMKDNIITTNTVLVDGNAAPISTHNANTFFSFRATGTSFKFLFANSIGALPNINGSTMIPNGSYARGLYLNFTATNVTLGVYKYNLEFISQNVSTVNLLNNAVHNVTISLTKEIVPTANITSTWYNKITCYKVDITIDGITYSMPYPAWNDLYAIASGGNNNLDKEREEDIHFLNDYRFLAITTTTATVQVKDLILY